MIELRISTTALSRAEVVAVTNFLNALHAPAAAGPTEVKQVFPALHVEAPAVPLALAAPVDAVAEAPQTAPEASAVFSQPVPAAPTSSTPAIAPPPASPTLAVDSKGLPWDGRIHASTRALLQDGSWRQKRGVDPDLLQRVEAELRGAQAAPAPAAAATVPPPPPAVAAAPAPDSALTFPALLQKITLAVASGAITQAQVVEACATSGVPSLPVLATRPDLLPSVAMLLGL